MAITRKPTDEPRSVGAVAEPVGIRRLSPQGWECCEHGARRPRKMCGLPYRFPARSANSWISCGQQSPVKTSRHHWVLEAIAQRIQRERGA